MTIYGICGDNCSFCPRYIATQNGNTQEFKKVKDLWVRIGLRASDFSAQEMACHGCKPENDCAYKELRNCVRARGVKNCGLCDEYPCETILAVFDKSEKLKSLASKVCTKEEIGMLQKAFFSKKKYFDSVHVSPVPCTWQPLSSCRGCRADGKLMCRFDWKDMLHFFMIILPFGITTIAGTIRAGYGWYLWLWLAYSLFFFFIWEARVLCRHCPYWAEDGPILHCHANYGVLKIWKYQPGPMSQWEKTQFVIGVLLLIGFPFPFLFLGQEHLLTIIGVCAALSGAYILRKNVCTRCINFSCPINAVPEELVKTYLRRNPDIQAAWELSGW